MRLGAVLLFLCWLAGCGYIGDPKPPALNIPESVNDLSVVQRGDRVLLQFTIPELTTEQLPVENPVVDLRGGTNEPGGFDAGAWGERAVRIPASADAPGPVQVETRLDRFAAGEFIFGVRTGNDRGRFSQWSNFVVLTLVPAVARPIQVKAESAPEGARVEWGGEAERWRVYRDDELLATAASRSYIDAAAEIGKQYRYWVQAIRKAGSGEAFSDRSEPVELTVEDRFAPPAVVGLTAIAGTSAVQLAWERSPAADIKHYRVWRDGNVVADAVDVPSYSDRTVERGRAYRYAVSAVDLRGNESPQTTAVEISLP